MHDAPRTAPNSIPQPSDLLLAPFFAVDAVAVGEVVPAFAPDKALLGGVAVLELLDEATPVSAAVTAASPVFTPALLNTPALTNFVHAPTTCAE